MTTVPKITSHENITEHYLKLNIETDHLTSGSVDFISEKINFNITGRYFFKGMVAIKNIQLEYNDGKLIFIFDSKKKLMFNCSSEGFEKVSIHIKTYANNNHKKE